MRRDRQRQTFAKMNSKHKSSLVGKGAGPSSTVSVRYLVLGISERDAQRLHGSGHGLHGGEDVLEDQFGVALLVLICVASSVDNPHLFDEGTLSTLSGTC